MSMNSKISWCHDTVNFWWGCERIAPGCKDCYAYEIAMRFYGDLWGATKPRLVIESAEKTLLALNRKAEREGERRRVFINSMSDFFEDFNGPVVNRDKKVVLQCDSCMNPDGSMYRTAVPPFNRLKKHYEHACGEHLRPATINNLRQRAFTLFDRCQHLDFLLLTKRPENIRRMWAWGWGTAATADESKKFRESKGEPYRNSLTGEVTQEQPCYRQNVWLGTSISDQPTFDRATIELLKCRDLSPVLFVSAEPLLGPVNTGRRVHCGCCNSLISPGHPVLGSDPDDSRKSWRGVDWVIPGVESSGQRVGRLGDFPDESAWLAGAADIVQQCTSAGVAAFVKQIPRGGTVEHDMANFPPELRVRQFPTIQQGPDVLSAMVAVLTSVSENVSLAASAAIAQLLLFADLGDLRRLRKPPCRTPHGELIRRRALAERERRRQLAMWALGLAGKQKRKIRPGKPKPPQPSGATEQRNFADGDASRQADGTTPTATPTGRRRSRPFKPLASELYNLPAALVDWMVRHELDLRHAKHLRAAHAALNKLANGELLEHRDQEQTELEYWEEMESYCDALDRLALKSPVVAMELARVVDSFEAQKAILHSGWSKNHLYKQNCYKQHPVTYEPQSLGNLGAGFRDVME